MISEIADILSKQDRILILIHASPDGDAVGSACALLRGLRKMGKRAAIKCADPIPAKFDYLFTGLCDVMPQADSFTPQLILSVDVADIRLLGSLKEEYRGKINLSIDHHASHVNFADIDYVDAGCAANTEIIYTLLLEMKADIDRDIANAIYTGLSTDTGCFRYRNVTWNTHAIASELIARGAESGDINQKMFQTRTRSQMEAELKVLKTMQFYFDSRCALIVVTQALMEETGLREEDVDAFVSKPREIEGVLVGIALKQRTGNGEEGFKVSFRTNPPADASAIAGALGGGGHKGAAACLFNGTLEQAKRSVLKACEDYLAGLVL